MIDVVSEKNKEFIRLIRAKTVQFRSGNILLEAGAQSKGHQTLLGDWWLSFTQLGQNSTG